jgi:hypothetical protein
MGGGRTSNKGSYKKEQETATRNLIASGAGGMDVEHFDGDCVSGEPPFCKCKVPLAERRVIKFGPNCERRFLRCLAWQDEAAIANWAKHPIHLEAKAQGIAKWYRYYHSMIAEVDRFHSHQF